MSRPGRSASHRRIGGEVRERWFRPASAYWRPELYERYFTDTPIGALLRRRDDEIVEASLARLLEPHHRVLEVGAGTGHYTLSVARRCEAVVALDAAPEMADYLRTRAGREGASNVEARMGRLPDEIGVDGPFDGVVCLGVLGYVDDLDAALAGLTARLRPGGWALVSMPPSTLEGRLHAVVELAARRRVSLRSAPQASAAARRAGLEVRGQARAGLTPGGITLLLDARRADGAA